MVPEAAEEQAATELAVTMASYLSVSDSVGALSAAVVVAAEVLAATCR